MIAQCLSYGGYHAVYVPTEDDDSVKEYIRMRDDHKTALKKIKQSVVLVKNKCISNTRMKCEYIMVFISKQRTKYCVRK